MPAKCPQRFGNDLILDLQRIGARAFEQPAPSAAVLSALPKPVSMSTTSGPGKASRIAATCSTSSVMVTSPLSGTPRNVLAMPAPVT